MACCRNWGAATLLLVSAISQPSQARRSQQIPDRMRFRGNGRTEAGSGAESSGEAIGEAGLGKRRLSESTRKYINHRRRGPDKLRLRRRDLLIQVAAGVGAGESSSETMSSAETIPYSSPQSERSSETIPESSSESSSESGAEDDLVVILEDHSDVMPPHLHFSESPASYRQPLQYVAKPPQVACRNCNLQGTASIEPEPAKPDGLNVTENADGHNGMQPVVRWSRWPERLDGLQSQATQNELLSDALEAQAHNERFNSLKIEAMQKKMAIAMLCNDRIYRRRHSKRSQEAFVAIYQRRVFTKAFTEGVVRAAEKIISKSLIFRVRLDGNRKWEADQALVSLREVLKNWTEVPGHVVAKALLDACNAMLREEMTMSAVRLQRTIRLYDEIIAILTKNVETESHAMHLPKLVWHPDTKSDSKTQREEAIEEVVRLRDEGKHREANSALIDIYRPQLSLCSQLVLPGKTWQQVQVIARGLGLHEFWTGSRSGGLYGQICKEFCANARDPRDKHEDFLRLFMEMQRI